MPEIKIQKELDIEDTVNKMMGLYVAGFRDGFTQPHESGWKKIFPSKQFIYDYLLK